MKKKKTGVMGGTFNPIPVGHLMLAQWAKDAAELDQILFMPAGSPYMKEGTFIAPGKERLHMVELAISDRSDFTVSGMELERSGYTYTYETMEQLQREEPDTEFTFIMGADSLEKIEYWREPRRIFNSCRVIAAARNGSDLQQMEAICDSLRRRYQARIDLLAFPAIEISSTDIRERIGSGQDIRYMVPERVRDYIISRGLYEKH